MIQDPAEFDKLLQEHAPRLLAWLEKRLPAALLARLAPGDILQEAAIVALSKYPAFKGQAEVSAYVWLFGIVRDCYHRHWQHHARACRSPFQEIPWPEHSSVQMGLGLAAMDSTPSAAVSHQEVQQRVHTVMQQLSEDDMEILALRYWENFSFAEIAAVNSIQEAAARKRHARALDRFHDLWQQQEKRTWGQT